MSPMSTKTETLRNRQLHQSVERERQLYMDIYVCVCVCVCEFVHLSLECIYKRMAYFNYEEIILNKLARIYY